MTKHQAILKNYPEVVIIRGDKAFDANGDEVIYDELKVKNYIDSNSYIEKRLSEYPPITDYIDGIVKGDQAQVNDYIKKCLAVKQKYPK
jgi:hypothetical protein